MDKLVKMMLIGLVPLILVGCGGSNGGDDSTAEENTTTDTNTESLAAVTSDNALAFSQDATLNVSDTGSSGEEMNTAYSSLAAIADSGAAMVMDKATASTATCPGGGTVTVGTLENAISYSAASCITADGVTLNGVLNISSGPWEETGTEIVMETGEAGFSNGTCSFSGGIAVRFKMEQNSVAAGTQTLIVAEYATSANGFTKNCGNETVTLAAGTSVRNEFMYTLSSTGELVSFSNTVSFGGKFEASDGSGYLNVTSTNLEYATNTVTNSSEYGTAQCPSSGSISVEGDGGSTVEVYFGPEAGDGYEVQVIGPDYTAQYTTCAEFLSATQ